MAKAEAVVEVLVVELDAAELEAFEYRRLFNEEVQAHAETLTRESDAWALYYQLTERDRRRWGRAKDYIDQLEAREFVRAKRGKWVGVALAAAFALGGYVGFILGLAS